MVYRMSKELLSKLTDIHSDLNLFVVRRSETKPCSNFEMNMINRILAACEGSIALIYTNMEDLDEAQSRYQDNGGF